MIILYFYFLFIMYLTIIIGLKIPQKLIIDNLEYECPICMNNFFIKEEENDNTFNKLINYIAKDCKIKNLFEIENIKRNSFDIIIYNYGTYRINISIDEVNYDKLMEELTDERLSKLNIEDPDKTLIITTKLIRGDKIDYYDFYNYLKNNYENSLEKDNKLQYEMDLYNVD